VTRGGRKTSGKKKGLVKDIVICVVRYMRKLEGRVSLSLWVKLEKGEVQGLWYSLQGNTGALSTGNVFNKRRLGKNQKEHALKV